VRLDKPEIIPWLWRFGGKESEETLVWCLKDRVKARSHDLGLKAGSVALERIPIMPGDLNGFDINREPLVAKIREAFKVVSPEDLMFLNNLQKN
jgi:hypothetical protein